MMESENSVASIWDGFSIETLVGKRVRIRTVEDNFYEGVIFVIDPIYKTVVLCDDDKIRMFVSLSIKSIEELSKDVVEPSFLEKPKPRDIGDWKNIEERMNRVINYFKQMFIDAKKDGENIIIDEHVSMAPPYTEETCYCDNTIILEKVRTIIGQMPSDFN